MRSHGADDRPQAHKRDFNRRPSWAHRTPMTERRRPSIHWRRVISGRRAFRHNAA